MAGCESQLAAYVQTVERKHQVFTAQGRWVFVPNSSANFVIRSMLDPALVESIIPFLPTTTALKQRDLGGAPQVPLPMVAKIAAPLRQLARECDTIYRENANVLDGAFDLVAEQKDRRSTTVDELARALLKARHQNESDWTPSSAELLAVRRMLNYDPSRFQFDRTTGHKTGIVLVTSKDDVVLHELVVRWVRDYQDFVSCAARNPELEAAEHSTGAQNVAHFIAKARRLAGVSRQQRRLHSNGTLSGSKARFAITPSSSALRLRWGESFTAADRCILAFLKAWTFGQRFYGDTRFFAVATTLVTATGLYADQHAYSHHGQALLVEMGVMSPYENANVYHLPVPSSMTGQSPAVDAPAMGTNPMEREDDFQDCMADLRRDWGDLTVYCVDAPGTKSVDDGFSVSTEAGEQWLHVHVANPTAFFGKDHRLGSLAERRCMSVFLPHSRYAMLPSWVAGDHFGLAANRPVLTFSARLGGRGNIVETKIQPGIIRNVVSLSPADLSGSRLHPTPRVVLGGEGSRGRPPKPRSPPANWSAQQKRELGVLRHVCRVRLEYRRARGAVPYAMRNAALFVWSRHGGPGLPALPPSMDRARFVEGDPVLELLPAPITDDSDRHQLSIVEEMMMLACEAAATWAAERQIPLPFRHLLPLPAGSDDADYYGAHVVPALGRCGGKAVNLPQSVLFQWLLSKGRSQVGITPQPHSAIGVSQYAKATSPLRRFTDMVVHWQIEAALRHEADTGRRFGPADADRLPYPPAQMQGLVESMELRESNVMRYSDAEQRYWLCHFFARAWFDGELPLPATFAAWVAVASQGNRCGVRIMAWGVRAVMLSPSEVAISPPAQPGDVWEVQFLDVSPNLMRLMVRPLRRLSTEAERLAR